MVTPEQARKMADWIAKDLGYADVADDVRDLASQVERLQADADRYKYVRELAWKEDDHLVVVIHNYSSDSSDAFAFDESVDALRVNHEQKPNQSRASALCMRG